MADIVVAERVFRDSNSGASVTARIFAPERNEDSSDWSCKICIEGLATPFERSIFGVDSFQALELATSLLCTLLESHEASLAFLDGSPGDCALPLIASCPPSLKAEVRAFIRTKIKDDLDSGQSALEQRLIAEITPETDNVVAERVFRESISGTCVTARIFMPERAGKSSEWSCKIEVQGLAMPFESSALGVDSFQSLYLGLRRLCTHLEKYEASLAFPDGPPGDGGLPLIALCLPPSLKPEVNRFIEGKIRDHLDSQEQA
ncbi:hypothetical protein V1294_004674 [Bradyrhizobium sp. AZCC 1678]|uniref:DUF6968 family protein n=1 Tax=Bradyrhizobium sp. AZCC 1678 TaxID=3117030 RepID=UPI002FF05882